MYYICINSTSVLIYFFDDCHENKDQRQDFGGSARAVQP